MNEPRDEALQALYQQDSVGPGGESPALGAKAARLVAGVETHREELDRLIEQAASGWRLGRMPVVDRAILRLATYELRHEPQTPVGVVLNEAVRLANTYSTARSGSFVNGVLAAIAGTVRDG